MIPATLFLTNVEIEPQSLQLLLLSLPQNTECAPPAMVPSALIPLLVDF